ncbi:hypothetical protein BB559_000339 [Furculomyces boomerangus]|uniref:Bromo domain-containing protein n=1 Tax=Furculomyces boomerangus TaxID=61424 RepID=A0A2T9Z5L9_9FUNG|nr:hypothetical protein BB559_000339 [Furculomyces boomerangus]
MDQNLHSSYNDSIQRHNPKPNGSLIRIKIPKKSILAQLPQNPIKKIKLNFNSINIENQQENVFTKPLINDTKNLENTAESSYSTNTEYSLAPPKVPPIKLKYKGKYLNNTLDIPQKSKDEIFNDTKIISIRLPSFQDIKEINSQISDSAVTTEDIKTSYNKHPDQLGKQDHIIVTKNAKRNPIVLIDSEIQQEVLPKHSKPIINTDVAKDEKIKNETVEISRIVFTHHYHKKYLSPVLMKLIRKLFKKDTYGMFWEPVNTNVITDYLNVISTPMDLSTMKLNVEKGLYPNLSSFAEDFELICRNAMTYNASSTVYYQHAQKLLEIGRIAIGRSARKLANTNIENDENIDSFELHDDNINEAIVDEPIHVNNVDIDEEQKVKSLKIKIEPLHEMSYKELSYFGGNHRITRTKTREFSLNHSGNPGKNINEDKEPPENNSILTSKSRNKRKYLRKSLDSSQRNVEPDEILYTYPDGSVGIDQILVNEYSIDGYDTILSNLASTSLEKPCIFLDSCGKPPNEEYFVYPFGHSSDSLSGAYESFDDKVEQMLSGPALPVFGGKLGLAYYLSALEFISADPDLHSNYITNLLNDLSNNIYQVVVETLRHIGGFKTNFFLPETSSSKMFEELGINNLPKLLNWINYSLSLFESTNLLNSCKNSSKGLPNTVGNNIYSSDHKTTISSDVLLMLKETSLLLLECSKKLSMNDTDQTKGILSLIMGNIHKLSQQLFV